MESSWTVRRIVPEDWPALRELRLAGLRADPLAFGSHYAREEESAPLKWQNWALRGSTGTSESIYVAENDPGGLVGMIGAYLEEERFHVWGMWVRPEQRGRGIAGDLLDTLTSWIAATRRPGPIFLEVNPTQRAAVALYAGRGFVRSGRTRPLGHHPPAIVEEMTREIPDT